MYLFGLAIYNAVSLVVRYILLLTAVVVWFALILAAEGVYTSFMRVIFKKQEENIFKKMFKIYVQQYSLAEQGYRKTVIFSLSMSFALLCVIFASLPFGIAVPILQNGGDLLQLFYAIMLSAAFVFIALDALNFSDKKYVFKKLLISVARLFLPFIACCISIASYLEAIGVAGDTFSLALLIESTPYNSMTKLGISGLALFGFIIFSQVYSEENTQTDCMLISMDDMPDFVGKSRFILQLWSLCIPYIVILLTEQIFFPWKYFALPSRGPLVALLLTIAGFVVFWLLLVFLRIIVVGICGFLMQYLKQHIPAKVYFLLLPILTLIAMILIFIDSIKVATEMYMY